MQLMSCDIPGKFVYACKQLTAVAIKTHTWLWECRSCSKHKHVRGVKARTWSCFQLEFEHMSLGYFVSFQFPYYYSGGHKFDIFVL
jgi:hypothetical protein